MSAYGALREGAGLAVAAVADAVFARGSEAASFCQGFVTNDLLVPVGSGSYGLAVALKGRIITDLVASRLAEDALLFLTPPGRADALATHLDRYLISEDAELTRAEGFTRLSLAGPRAGALLAGRIETLPAREGDSVAVDGGWCVRSAWTEAGGSDDAAPCFDLLLPDAAAERWREGLEADGAVAVGDELALVALENGRPGPAVLADLLPQEADLERAVCYTKGCYLGQETVARVHYKGGVKKMLSGLVSASPLAVETALHDAERAVGTVRASAVSPRLGKALHIALLRLESRAPGTVLQTVDGTEVEVVAWPLA